MVPLGQKSITSAVPPKLANCSPARRRAVTRLSLVTGEKPVGAYWGTFPFSPPSAVHSAGPLLPPSHRRRLSWRSDVRLLVCVIGLLALNLGKVYAGQGAFVKPPKKICGRAIKFLRKNWGKCGGTKHASGADDAGRMGVTADIRTRSRTGTQCRRPGSPSPPAAGRGRTAAGSCRTTCGSRSRRS